MKTVLITGSNGLLGQKLIDLYLQKSDIKLVATALGDNRHPTKEGYIYREMDITNYQEVHAVIFELKPDVLIHGAAMTDVDSCELDPQNCRKINVDAVEYLVKASNAVGCHFIHVSTDFIFDGTSGPYKETDTPNPISFYGQCKLEGERIVQENSDSWAIARTILVYGIVADMSRSNIVLWAQNALEKREPINVVNDQYRTPTLAEDLAMGCYLIEQQKASGIYNISGKDFMNIYEIVQQVGWHFGLSIESVTQVDSKSLKQPANRPPVTGFDLTKSRKELGYEPHSFDEGIDIVHHQHLKRMVE
jgi:dTDP-4-dehydrorhamnose reductase